MLHQLQTHLPSQPWRCHRVFSFLCPHPLPKVVGSMAEIPLWGGKKRMRPELLVSKDRHIAAEGPPSAPCAAASLGPLSVACPHSSAFRHSLGAGPDGQVFPVGREQKGKFLCQNQIFGREAEAALPAPTGVTWPLCFPLEACRTTVVRNY